MSLLLSTLLIAHNLRRPTTGTLAVSAGLNTRVRGPKIADDSAVLGVNYDSDYLEDGVKCVKVAPSTAISSMSANFGMEVVVIWSPSFPGEIPANVQPDGTIAINLSFASQYKVTGVGTAKIFGSLPTPLVSRTTSTTGWLSLESKTEEVRLLPQSDGTYEGSCFAGGYTLEASTGTSTEVKLTSTSASYTSASP